MERHNFHGQRATHGVKKVHRHAGSIGQSQFPGHVPKGRRMAGQYGNERSTMRNLKLVRVDAENNLLLVRGAVPGPEWRLCGDSSKRTSCKRVEDRGRRLAARRIARQERYERWQA